ncbi:MAG TPA: hypothetical protein VMU34_04265 [Mycobacterium sp.]|nr:hypothetical protein [Mycobacterium sp.]
MAAAAVAEDKVSEAADRLKKKAETARDRLSEHWTETREQRHGDDGGAREDVTEGIAGTAPECPARPADPIDFAEPSVDEAEEGVFDALDTRATSKPPDS